MYSEAEVAFQRTGRLSHLSAKSYIVAANLYLDKKGGVERIVQRGNATRE